jgi:hypothetical protein
MSDYIKIYFYKVLNWLANPFLVWKGRKNGIEDVANQFLHLARKVTPVDGFYHSFKNMNVSYDLFNGVFFRSDKYDSNVLSIVNKSTPDKSIDIHHFDIKYIPIFSPFYDHIVKNCSSMQRWSVHYKNKKITHILCKLKFSYVNSENEKLRQNIYINIYFDTTFKVIALSRDHFNMINSVMADLTLSPKPYLVQSTNFELNLDFELLLIILSVSNKNSRLGGMFPEYFNDTVCDYSSEEFQQRVDLYLMEYY